MNFRSFGPPPDYPWLATLMDKSSGTVEYFCGATLISYKHVLSTAHCFQNKGKKTVRPLNTVLALFGVYDLDDPYEDGRIASSIKSLHIHPDWDSFATNYDADLSILEINANLSPNTNEFIQPICLWNLKEEPEEDFGTIVGYGKSENKELLHEKKPKDLKVTIYDSLKCILDIPLLARILSTRTLCAGSGNGTSPCIGDAGFGLFINHGGTFYLRGIIASALERDCELNKYAIYTNVLKFKDWISTFVPVVDQQSNQLTTTTARSLPSNEGKKSECGVRKVGRGTIIGGSTFEHGDYPWMVALFNDVDYDKTFGYFCGGVIISNKRILTAAHCLYNRARRLLERNILVTIGGHDLEAKHEIGKTIHPVNSMQIHPKWNPRTQSFDADIAFLDLDSNLYFNVYTQPICLIDPSQENSMPIEGVILGYGKSENPTKPHETIPRELKVSIVSNEDCWSLEPDLLTLSSKRTFCAGTLNGTGACRGDSGHGLFVKVGNVFYLRGLISASLLNVDDTCNVDKYGVFTNVLKYRDWFDESINKNDYSDDFAQRIWT